MMNIIHIAVANLSLGAALPTPPVAYVSAGDRLMVVDPAMGRIEAVIELPASDGFPPAVSPDGAFVYVPSGGSTVEEGSVYVIDAATNTLDAEIEAGIRPVAVAFTPDGAFAYVANQWESSVSVVDTATLDIVATVRVGFLPSSIAMAPDGTFAYVANLGPGGLGAPGAVDTVSVIDTSTNTVEAVIDVSPIPVDVAITPDGSRAYVLSTLFDEFSLIDTATHEVDETFPLGDGRRVIFSPDGELAYLLGYEMISVIRTETNTIEAAIPENGCDMALT
ncbi:MAG: YncE family protein, partial [Gammaproteobacteria bacterium]|nr:YncE family protein [Gammaproteobacteria bacterium]